MALRPAPSPLHTRGPAPATESRWLTEADERMRAGTSEAGRATDPRSRPAGRILELDALRGLAAVTVLIAHTLAAFPGFIAREGEWSEGVFGALRQTPLATLFAGKEAVVLFFVLSGFVLALPFLGERRPTYLSFLVRRVFRLYPAYIFAVLAGCALVATLSAPSFRGLSQEFASGWQAGTPLRLVVEHLTMLTNFDDRAFDGPVWSLVVEMRMSLLFPLLVGAFLWLGPVRWFVGCLLIAAAGYKLGGIENSDAWRTAYGETLQYVPCFAAGILLARYRHQIADFVARLPSWAPLVAVAAALLAYTWRHLPAVGPAALHNSLMLKLVPTAGAAVFVVASLNVPRISRALRGVLPQYLGRVSYSLYLVHWLALRSCVYLLHPSLPLELILPLAWIVSFASATAMQRWIEVPFIALGRRAAHRLDGWRASRRRVRGMKPAPANPS